MTNIDHITAAEQHIRHQIITTPLLTSDRLNLKLPFDLYLKADCLQRTGSFKFRGAANALACLDKELDHHTQPILAFSSGNHGQAIALACRLSGRQATIIMPKDAPKAKINGIVAYGGKTIFYDRYTQSREEIAAELVERQHAILIPPYDHADVIAGQGTAGLEIAKQANSIGIRPDVFVCCAGGGGLLAGTSIALKQAFPDIHLHSAEPAGFDDMARSLEARKIQYNSGKDRSICDAIVTPCPGKLTFPIIRKLVRSGFAVSDDETLSAMRVAWDYFKITVEPGGAVALASILTKSFIANHTSKKRQTIIAMISGGNCDPDLFRRALTIKTNF